MMSFLTANMLLSVFFPSGASAACTFSDLFITTPQKMEALTGSCLEIPCDFSATTGKFKSQRTAEGVWIKNTTHLQNAVFNSSRTINIYPMKMTGNLNQKNCTTLFSNLTTSYTDTYYFRIYNVKFRATAVCDPVQITIKDSPRSPTIQIPGDLKEKQSVTITCSALTPCPHSPPQLTWNLQQDSHSQIEENTDRTLTTRIQETITLSDTHDGYNISCSATYPVNEGKHVKTAETQVTLSVSYAPKDTSASISPSGLVSAGSWVNLSCSSRAKPPVSSFSWFTNSSHGAIKVSEGHFYSFNVTHEGLYYCVATNDLGNQTSAQIHLNIAGTEQSSSWGGAVGGIIGIIILICVVFILWRLKSTRPTSHQTQSPVPDPGRTGENDDIHYGEIDFSKLRPEPSSDSVQDSMQRQDAVYSQVKVCKTENSLTQTGDGPECIYSHVKKK